MISSCFWLPKKEVEEGVQSRLMVVGQGSAEVFRYVHLKKLFDKKREERDIDTSNT